LVPRGVKRLRWTIKDLGTKIQLGNYKLQFFILKRVLAVVKVPQDWHKYLFYSSRVSVLKNSLMQSNKFTG